MSNQPKAQHLLVRQTSELREVPWRMILGMGSKIPASQVGIGFCILGITSWDSFTTISPLGVLSTWVFFQLSTERYQVVGKCWCPKGMNPGIYHIVTSTSLTETLEKSTWTAPRSQSRHMVKAFHEIFIKHVKKIVWRSSKQTRTNSPKPKKTKLCASTCIKKNILLKKSSTHFFPINQHFGSKKSSSVLRTLKRTLNGPSVPLTDLQHWADSQTHPAPEVAPFTKTSSLQFLRRWDGWDDLREERCICLEKFTYVDIYWYNIYICTYNILRCTIYSFLLICTLYYSCIVDISRIIIPYNIICTIYSKHPLIHIHSHTAELPSKSSHTGALSRCSKTASWFLP